MCRESIPEQVSGEETSRTEVTRGPRTGSHVVRYPSQEYRYHWTDWGVGTQHGRQRIPSGLDLLDLRHGVGPKHLVQMKDSSRVRDDWSRDESLRLTKPRRTGIVENGTDLPPLPCSVRDSERVPREGRGDREVPTQNGRPEGG